jgi:hypothetical protein
VRPFLDEMDLHLMAIRVGVQGATSHAELYIRTRLQQSPPFTKCPHGFIRDLHEYELDGPLVACPKMAALLDTLTEILIEYGTSFVELIGPRRKRREFEQAKSFIHRAAEVLFPRNQRLRKRFQDVINTLLQKIGGNYARLDPHQQEHEKRWRDGLAHHMTLAFQTFGPPQTDYPKEAVYCAIAAIYEALDIEHRNMKLGDLRTLGERIRKRCQAHRTLN